MIRSMIALLLLASVTFGQHRSLPPDSTPAPSSPGNVTLSLAEYNRLVELAARKKPEADVAPLPFVLGRAAFKVRLENDSLIGDLDIGGAVLQKGAARVPLITGLTVLEAQQSGGALPLLQEGAAHVAILNPGPFAVALTVAAPLTVEAGRASFTLPVPAASNSLLTLDLPGAHANVKVEPGLITSRTNADGHTVIEATLEPGKTARVWWTTREITAPMAQREVRFLSDIKTVISVGDSQLRLAALCDVTVIQGEPAEFKLPLPAGFELTEVTGSTLDASETQGETLVLKVREPARRTHQFLLVIERASRESKVDAPLLAFSGAQHETGELLVEGLGAMELTATESGGLRRMDVREAGAIARSLARFPLQAAFRYNRRGSDAPKLQLEWTQFPDSAVLSAVAERATITTLTNVEGKSLTEVMLRVKNHAQPFVKVDLPAGATLLSAEVEGERVKPVLGADGSRVPLLRAGFNPSGAYTVSFVYLSSGARFGKNGAYEMALPKLDVPVNLLSWEVLLPDRLDVRQFGGNALAAEIFPAAAQDILASNTDDYGESELSVVAQNSIDSLEAIGAGQIGGIIADPSGAVVSGATITVTNKATGFISTTRSDAVGRWAVSGVQPGPVKVTVESSGFRSWQQDLDVSASRPTRLGTTLDVGAAAETVTVTSKAAADLEREGRKIEEQARKNQAGQANAPSQNVLNLQKRVSGILPVRVEVPRTGKSYRFVRPLVLEEETKITFQYKSK